MTEARLRLSRLALVLAIAMITVSCGDSSASLTGPSGSRAGSGARITGRVIGMSGLNATTADSSATMSTTSGTMATAPTSAVRVTINGTGLSTTVDGSGNFTLTEVPPGTVQLTFTGPSLNASITLSQVQDGDQIQVEVRIDGGRAKIEFEIRHSNGNDGDEVEGRISAVDASARTLRVAGVMVSVPESAKIHRGSRTLRFSDLAIGQEVEVHGVREGTTIRATDVKLEDDHDDDDDRD